MVASDTEGQRHLLESLLSGAANWQGVDAGTAQVANTVADRLGWQDRIVEVGDAWITASYAKHRGLIG